MKKEIDNYQVYRTLAPLPENVIGQYKVNICPQKAPVVLEKNNKKAILSSIYKFQIGVDLCKKISRIEFIGQKQMSAKENSLFWKDISATGDGSVMGCVEYLPEKNTYVLRISADGKIYAPKDSNMLFGAWENVEEIIFGDVFDTSEVTNMSQMFSYCGNLRTLDASKFDTRKVTNMRSMFSFCGKLKTLDISGFDTENVTDMGFMFCQCKSVENLAKMVKNFKTNNVKKMEKMFSGCKIRRMDILHFLIRNADKKDIL